MLAPPDVCWFKVLKSLYIKDWNHWFQFGEKTFTKSHNLRGPGYVLMCQWIEKAWIELKADYIAESFKYCGITTSVIAEYQSNLIKLLTDAELPLNSSVEARNEEDEHTDIFLNHDADEGPASETNSSTDGSTESVSASEQSTSDTSTSESSPASPTTTTTTASTYITESTKTPSTTAPPTATQSTPVLKDISNITITRINKPKALSTSTPRVKSTSLSALDQSQRASNIENLLLPPKPVVPRPATPPTKEKQPEKHKNLQQLPKMFPPTPQLAIQWWLDLILPQWLQSIAHKEFSITNNSLLVPGIFNFPQLIFNVLKFF